MVLSTTTTIPVSFFFSIKVIPLLLFLNLWNNLRQMTRRVNPKDLTLLPQLTSLSNFGRNIFLNTIPGSEFQVRSNSDIFTSIINHLLLNIFKIFTSHLFQRSYCTSIKQYNILRHKNLKQIYFDRVLSFMKTNFYTNVLHSTRILIIFIH